MFPWNETLSAELDCSLLNAQYWNKNQTNQSYCSKASNPTSSPELFPQKMGWAGKGSFSAPPIFLGKSPGDEVGEQPCVMIDTNNSRHDYFLIFKNSVIASIFVVLIHMARNHFITQDCFPFFVQKKPK